ncbi:hypothetical protein E1H12_09010 [Geitlerinema sp. P-1104]|uniref:hypothetical protein n=1 Tax=Geitlerinema sp. P-1104 TaxID=2546230 RepID=UPI001476CD90|nr:hypothetical protein [Geitlerinema sp. P-1104]NMG58656.1 hypothetical protein [Geitlerinema sp. P-1104]
MTDESQQNVSTGIQWGSAFLVVFLLLGYDTLPSLLLASSAGVAAGTVTSAWRDRTLPEVPLPEYPANSFRRFGTEEPPHHLKELSQRQARYQHQRQVIRRGRPSPIWEVILARLGLTQLLESDDELDSDEEDEASSN